MTITVHFSCIGCGLERASCEVPVREENEDVKHWVLNIMGHAIAAEHERRSPYCTHMKTR